MSMMGIEKLSNKDIFLFLPVACCLRSSEKCHVLFRGDTKKSLKKALRTLPIEQKYD
jgi:hypothetical protein